MTTSTEAARLIGDHMTSFTHPSIRRVEVLEPHPENQPWAHAVLVIHLKTGERFGMEVCPFPGNPVQPSGNLRTMTEHQEPEIVTATREWHREARVRITAAYGAGNAHTETRDFKPGEELKMVQWGRAGRAVEDTAWWTNYDIDGAFIIPADHLEVLEITEEVTPTEPEPTEDPSTITAPGDEPPVPVEPPYENPV